MAEWQIPGLAVAVVHRDEPVLVHAYGQRDLEAALPVTTDTQFLLCSITKTFTATGLAMLADQRLLDWHKPVREYLPEFRLHDAVATERVTVADLLCHRTGLPRHDWVHMPADRSRAELLAAMQHLEPSRDIRQSFQYQNLGYLAAGMVAEQISGQSWEAFTRRRILEPLGMRQAGFSAESLAQATDAARAYVSQDNTVRRTEYWPISVAPAGAITAAISDMVPYLCFLLAGGSFDGNRLLSAANLRLLQTPHVHAGRSEFDEIGDLQYGYGFGCTHYRGERSVGHSGGWIGWSTRLDMLPDRKLGVVVLTNHSPSPVPGMLCHAVFDRLSAPLEPMVSDIVFRRLPAGEATDPAFRAACTGTHRGGSTLHVVVLDADGQLRLSPAGQPTYQLVPYQGATFTVAPLEGYRVEFQRGAGDAVETIIFHQPNGTFRARRVDG